MRRSLLLLLFAAAACAEPWHTDLCTGGADLWHARVAVDLTNTGDGALGGFPVELPIGPDAGQLPLLDTPAAAVRVCDPAGTERLFDLRGPGGARLQEGVIPAGSTLAVPAALAPQGSERLYVYYANPQAYPVPDYLQGRAGAPNGGFESGAGDAPEGWQFDSAAPDRHNVWSTESPHAGKRCVKTVVAAGAEPSWIAVRQSELALVPGKPYRVTAWVKAENVVGYCGWYLHVATPDDPMKLGPIERAGDGTFDWKQVTLEFTAPPDATTLQHGTVLWGTGTAWFDDVKVECLAPPTTRFTIGPAERVDLAEFGLGGEYYREGGRSFECRIPAVVVNAGEAVRQALVQVPAAALLTRLRRGFNPSSLRVVDPATGQALPCLRAGDELVFVADLPPRARKQFGLYFSADMRIPAGRSMAYGDLLNSPANLVRNPSFEDADAMQANWPGGTEGQQAAAVKVERVAGGKFGGQCVRITVPPEAPANWVGWRQKLKVAPGGSYFVAAWLRAQGLSGEARVHGHFLDDAGQLAGQKYWSTGGSISGSADWTLVSGLVSMTGPVSTFELHLTMAVRGVLEHDGAVMMRTLRASLGEIEQRQARAGLAVWAEDPLVKVFRDTPAGKLPASLELAAGRNAAECLQLCLRSSAAAGVTVKLEALRNGTAALSPGRIETVGYVPCLQPSGYFSSTAKPYERRLAGGNGRTDGWRGWWPDYLLPSDGKVSLEAGRTQPVWITWTVPKDAAPGDYRGAVVVQQAGQPAVRVPVRLRVWRFTMPDRPSLQVIYDLRNGPGWSTFRKEEDWRTWWRFMAEHHVCPDEVQPRAAFKLVDGKVAMDTAAFDRAASYCYDELQMSAGYFAGPFYACGWAHPPSPFLGLKYPSPEYKAAYSEAVRLYWQHLKAKGWADRLSLYVSDEPYADRKEVIQWLGDIIGYTRAVDPAIPVYCSTWGHVKPWDGVLDHVGLGQYGVYPMGEWAERRKAGDKAWFTTDGQMEIDTPYNATERMLPWYCFTHDVDGYEFWGFSWYTYDPYKFGWHSFIYQSGEPGKYDWVRYPNGDGYIAYPGEPLGRSGPLSTIRLEEARAGIEDYDLLLAARAAAARQPTGELAKALAEVAGLTRIPNAGGFRSTDILPDPDALTKLRRRIGDLLDKTP